MTVSVLFRACALATLACLTRSSTGYNRAAVKLVRATPAPPATPTPVARPVAFRSPAALPAGPRALLPLAERCILGVFGRYTYEVCPFKNISQRDTSFHYFLGIWGGWKEDENSMGSGTSKAAVGARMQFSDGCTCGGKRRQAVLTLTCGKDSILLDVSESPTCEYSLTLSSPEACIREEEAAVATAAVAVVTQSPAPASLRAATYPTNAEATLATTAATEDVTPPSAAVCTGPISTDATTRALCEEVASLRRALVGLAAVVVEQSTTPPPTAHASTLEAHDQAPTESIAHISEMPNLDDLSLVPPADAVFDIALGGSGDDAAVDESKAYTADDAIAIESDVTDQHIPPRSDEDDVERELVEPDRMAEWTSEPVSEPLDDGEHTGSEVYELETGGDSDRLDEEHEEATHAPADEVT